jgi:L-idonate 5-dehydrogenase
MNGRSGSYELQTPFVLGHEGSGIIVEIGTAVESVAVGDQIAINPSNPCRHCYFCVRGRSNLCENMRYFGSASTNPPVDGLFSRYVILRIEQCIPLPSNLPHSYGPLVEPASVAMHAVNRSGLRAGDNILIIGAGAVGLLILRIAQAIGIRSVSVVEPSELRREGALKEGAAFAVTPQEITSLPSPDVAFECSGTSSGLSGAIEIVRRGGVVVQVGGMLETTPISSQLLMSRELSLFGSFRFAEEPTQVIGLIEANRLSLDGLIESEWSFGEIDGALRAAASGKYLKVGLKFEEY